LKANNHTIYTIGHSTRNIIEFLEILQSFQIETLVDVRHYPGSRKFPQYNQAALHHSLNGVGIQYSSLPALGGRRKPKADSLNKVWRNDAFRAYADYMETGDFQAGIIILKEIAQLKRTTIMCSEAVWWRCHRSLIADFLKAEGWKVMHIMKKDVSTEHPFTSAYLENHYKGDTPI
jgi:uncharacterized protein (DUF488 family)